MKLGTVRWLQDKKSILQTTTTGPLKLELTDKQTTLKIIFLVKILWNRVLFCGSKVKNQLQPTPTGAFEALFCLLLKDIKGLFVTFYVKKVILFNSAPLSKHDTQLPKKGLEGR